MNLEQRIRDALQSEDRAQPTPEAWQAVHEAANDRRRRRRAIGYPLAGLAIVAAVVGFVVGIVLLRDGADNSIAAGPSARPEHIVAIRKGSIVVLSSADGRVERTILSRTEADRPTSIAVSADGETAYFTRVDPDAGCEPPANEIATVPIGGGRVRTFARGQSPVLSSDGRRIAYVRPAAGQCGAPFEIVIQELDNRTSREQLVPLEANRGAWPLSWSPDGARLLLAITPSSATALPGEVQSTEVREFDTDTGEITRLPVGQGLGGIGALSPRYLGSATEVIELRQRRHETHAEAKSLTTSASRELFTVRGRGWHGLAVDPSGRHVLVAMENILDGTSLFTWSRGEEPTRVARGVFAAAWVP
jgi:DNA-binding beta-propeller fold protein YncE